MGLRKQDWQREMLSCDAVTTKASATPMAVGEGGSRAGRALQSGPDLGQWSWVYIFILTVVGPSCAQEQGLRLCG